MPLAAGRPVTDPNDDGPTEACVNSVELTMSPSPSCISMSELGSIAAEAAVLKSLCDHALGSPEEKSRFEV